MIRYYQRSSLSIIIVIVITMTAGFHPSKAEMSEAQTMGALYGVLLGHIDACGLTIERWHTEAMGRQISRLAKDDNDRELAIALFRSMVTEAQKSPSMTCSEVRRSLKQSEDDLR